MLPDILASLPIVLLTAAAEDPIADTGATGFANLMNFLIVFGFLFWVVKRFKVFSAIDTQHEAIVKALHEAKSQRDDALGQLDEVKRRTQNLNQEVEEILTTARTSAENLAHQIVDDARKESGKILEAAKRRVELEQRSAMKALEARLLNDALQEVRANLTQNLDAAKQERSVDAFLDELSASSK